MKLRILLAVAMCATAVATLPVDAATEASASQIGTEGGLVSGIVDDGIASFKGIPYAQPPVGELRWRAPRPIQNWTGVRNADNFAPDCMQAPIGAVPPSGQHPVAEDCLYLNIWRPAAVKKKLPVMVWIHGGGFVNGGSSSPDATGESMAARGLVFVNFNYRLGRFGFFGFPALAAEHPEEAKGNYGLMDQIAALQWVKRNIADFGGDPGNVTVVGESAGGMSINMLLTSPAVHGLFQRAIVQSGAGRKLPRERHLDKDLTGAASATTLGIEFARRHHIEGQDAGALAKLRALSAEQITDGLNMATVLLGDKSLYAGPVVDGRLLPETPQKAYAAGRQMSVPLIVGTTSWDLGFNAAKTPGEAFAAFGNDAGMARSVYDPEGRGDIQAINAAIAGDRAMVEPARFIARSMHAVGMPVFEYRFGYVLEAKRAQSPYGAQHATDVPFAFGRLDAVHGNVVTSVDRSVSDTMADYWANFARRDDPNGKRLPGWPVYHAEDDMLLMFGADGAISARRDPWKKRLDITERAAAYTPATIAGRLPASYEGELPCADCAAVHYHLDLFPDHLYYLRGSYEGEPRRSDTIGAWTTDPEGIRLTVERGQDDPLEFEIGDATTLYWLKRKDSAHVAARAGYALARTEEFQPVEPHATLTGMYRYFADSGTFVPCGTQSRLPVAQEGENATLEATYGRVVPEPRGEVLAQLEGRIVMRPRTEGDGMLRTLVVERVGKLQPGKSCTTRETTSRLEGPSWKLTHLGNVAVTLKPGQVAPYFVLDSVQHRVSGNSGCNRMAGQYTLDGNRLEFGKMMSTRMACLAGMDTEQAFLAALGLVQGWRLDSRSLVLLDAEGHDVARFEMQP